MNYGEGPLLGVATRIASGLSSYPDPHPIPYVINPYGPVAYYLFAGEIKPFGVGFTAPRIFVVAATLCCAALITLLLCHWTGSVRVGVAFGGPFLTLPAVLQWMILFRVDLMALAFALAGMYFFATSRPWFLSVIFFVTAFFCKFTFVAAPAACVIFMVANNEWRKALKFVGSFAGLAAAFFFVCQLWTKGWFAFHTIGASTVHPFSMKLWLDGTLDELNYILVPFVLTVVICFRRRSWKDISLPFIYLILATLSTILRGKLGSDFNYYLEWEAALCLCLGFEYGLLQAEPPASSAARAFVPALLACSILAITHWINFDNDAILRATRAGCRDAYQFVKDHRQEQMLTDNTGALIVAGAAPVVFEPFLWTREVVGAGWPDAEVLDLIRSRRISLVLLDQKVEKIKTDPQQVWWPRSVAGAIDQNYTLARDFKCAGANFVYQPRASRGH
jgi:hypothetical protein